MQVLFKFNFFKLKIEPHILLEKIKTAFKTIGLMYLIISLAGCTSFGTIILPKNRAGFGRAMIVSEEQQLLLNIVRIQFEDRPVFVSVDSITTSNSLSSSVSGSWSLSSSPSRSISDSSFSESFGLSRSYSISPNVSYSDSPTVSFTPLQGEKFMRNILHPITLSDVYLLLSSGWAPDRMMRIVFERFYAYPNKGRFTETKSKQEVPNNKKFEEVASLIADLAQDGLIYFSLGQVQELNMPADQVNFSF